MWLLFGPGLGFFAVVERGEREWVWGFLPSPVNAVDYKSEENATRALVYFRTSPHWAEITDWSRVFVMAVTDPHA